MHAPTSMAAILAIVRKDFLQLRRDPAALFFTLGWPLIVAVMFGVLFGGDGGSTPPKVTLVDSDRSVQSTAFARTIEALDTLSVDRGGTVDTARDAVRRGERTAAIVVPKGWGASGGGGFNPDAMAIDLLVDPSRKAEQAMLEGMLVGAAMQSLTDTSDPAATRAKMAQAKADVQHLPPAARDSYSRFFDALGDLPTQSAAGTGNAAGTSFTPLKLQVYSVEARRSGPANSHAVTFPQGMFWAVLGCLMSFATTLATERSEGTWLRLRTAPVASWRLLAGKGLACGLAMMLALNVLALVGAVAFGVSANWLLLEIAFLCGAFAFTALMMVLAMLGGSVRAASGYAWAVLMPLAMLGGAMIPLFVMPSWMQTAALASPVRWLIVAIEGATWRGFSPAEMVLPCAILLAVGAVLLLWVRLRARVALG